MKPDMEQVPKDLLKASYKKAFSCANKTVFTVVRRCVLKATQFYETIDIETGKEVCGKLQGQALVDSIQKPYKDARSAAFKYSFRAAYHAALSVQNARKDTGLTDTLIGVKRNVDNLLPVVTDENDVFVSAVRASYSASRSASRHAIRLAALDAAFGPHAAADVAEYAINCVISQTYKTDVVESIFSGPEFKELVSVAREETSKAYQILLQSYKIDYYFTKHSKKAARLWKSQLLPAYTWPPGKQ
jgi:hypothetical protein